MADLTVTITESVTLNGASRGSTNTLTVAGVDDIYHRIVTVPSGASDTTLVAFKTAQTGADGAIDRDLVKYIRITNMESSNPVILNIQQQEAEHATNAGDQNLAVQLSAKKSFMLGEAHDCIDVEGGANDIDALSNLHDVESIMVDPLAAECRVEIFIASVV